MDKGFPHRCEQWTRRSILCGVAGIEEAKSPSSVKSGPRFSFDSTGLLLSDLQLEHWAVHLPSQHDLGWSHGFVQRNDSIGVDYSTVSQVLIGGKGGLTH